MEKESFLKPINMLLYSNVNFGLHFVKKKGRINGFWKHVFQKWFRVIRQILQNRVKNIANDYLWYNPDITIDKETIFFNNYFDYGI